MADDDRSPAGPDGGVDHGSGCALTVAASIFWAAVFLFSIPARVDVDDLGGGTSAAHNFYVVLSLAVLLGAALFTWILSSLFGRAQRSRFGWLNLVLAATTTALVLGL